VRTAGRRLRLRTALDLCCTCAAAQPICRPAFGRPGHDPRRVRSPLAGRVAWLSNASLCVLLNYEYCAIRRSRRFFLLLPVTSLCCSVLPVLHFAACLSSSPRCTWPVAPWPLTTRGGAAAQQPRPQLGPAPLRPGEVDEAREFDDGTLSNLHGGCGSVRSVASSDPSATADGDCPDPDDAGADGVGKARRQPTCDYQCRCVWFAGRSCVYARARAPWVVCQNLRMNGPQQTNTDHWCDVPWLRGARRHCRSAPGASSPRTSRTRLRRPWTHRHQRPSVPRRGPGLAIRPLGAQMVPAHSPWPNPQTLSVPPDLFAPWPLTRSPSGLRPAAAVRAVGPKLLNPRARKMLRDLQEHLQAKLRNVRQAIRGPQTNPGPLCTAHRLVALF